MWCTAKGYRYAECARSDYWYEKRQEKIAKANKFKITDHSMQLYGICESCQ